MASLTFLSQYFERIEGLSCAITLPLSHTPALTAFVIHYVLPRCGLPFSPLCTNSGWTLQFFIMHSGGLPYLLEEQGGSRRQIFEKLRQPVS